MQKTHVNKLFILIVGLFLLLLGACSNNSEEQSAEDIVAVVNGEEISKSTFDEELANAKQLYTDQGMNVEDLDDEAKTQIEQSVLDQLINTELLLQTAKDEGLSIDEEAVDTEISSMKSQFEDEEQFTKALEDYNLTEGELKKQLGNQQIVTQYIDQQIGEINVSDDELQTMYAQFEEQAKASESEAPDFETVKPQLEQQIMSQKRNEKTLALIEELREKNKESIEVLL